MLQYYNIMNLVNVSANLPYTVVKLHFNNYAFHILPSTFYSTDIKSKA